MLNEFVVQFDRAIKDHRNAEEIEDFITLNSNIVTNSSHSIDQQFEKSYTRKVYDRF